MNKVIGFSALLFFNNILFAQEVYENKLSCKISPDGIALYLSHNAIGDFSGGKEIVSVIIERALPGEKNFSQISTVKMAATVEEFKKEAGSQALEYIMKIKKLKSDKEAYDYIARNPSVDSLSSLVFDQNFMAAIGAIYVDRQVFAVVKTGTVRYKAKYIKRPDKSVAYVTTGEIKADDSPSLSKPIAISKSESDDYISIEWRSPADKSADALFADVYKSDDFKKEFIKAGKIFALRYDSINIVSYNWTEKVKPGSFYRYFIKPLTITGVEGPASDTAQIVSVSTSSVPAVSNLMAIDSTPGVLLKWRAMTKNNLSNGLAIERSRKAEADFIAIDTVASADSMYWDMRVIPGLSYFYRTRTLTIRNDALPPSAFTSVNFTGRGLRIYPPVYFSAHAGAGTITLNWHRSSQPGIAGYRIFRSSGINDSLAVHVSLINDTFFVDTILLFPLRNYRYAIAAVSYDDRTSAWSDIINVHLTARQAVSPPAGLVSSSEPGKVTLLWNDMRRNEPLVAGYNIYRFSSGGYNPPSAENSVDLLLKAGFTKINPVFISASFFSDKGVVQENKYSYAVTTVTVDGVESAASEIVSAEVPGFNIPAPMDFSLQKGIKGLVISWTAPRITGINECMIYRRSAAEAEPKIISRTKISAGSFTDESPEHGTFFYSIAYSSDRAMGSRSLEKGFVK